MATFNCNALYMGDSKIHSSFLLFIRILAEVSFVFMAAALPTNKHYSALDHENQQHLLSTLYRHFV